MTKEDYIRLRDIIAKTFHNPDGNQAHPPWEDLPELRKNFWRLPAEKAIKAAREAGFKFNKE